MFEHISDYSTAGANPLRFDRYYNSLADTKSAATMLGMYWRSTYDRFLRLSNSVVAERADGQELTFYPANGTNWASDSDVDVQLLQSGSAWMLIDSDDTVETYNTVGNVGLLASIQSVNGYTQTMNYNGNNQLTSVIDSLGRSLTLAYQSNLLRTLSAPNGLVLTYSYTAAGGSGTNNRLASVTFSTTPQASQSYVYENTKLPFALTGVYDEDGNRFASWTYDAYGRGLTSQHANGADLTSVYYDDANATRMVTNALGEAMVYKFSLLQHLSKATEIDRLATATTPAAVMTLTYDTNGYVARISDWNTNSTTFTNDHRGLPIAKNEAANTPQARTTSNLWHPTLHLPLVVAAPRLTSTFIYDTNGNLLSHTDTDTTTNVTSGQVRVWTNTYGSFGHLLTATGPRTDAIATTGYTYDTNGNVSTITDPLGHVTQFTNYNGSGLPGKIIDPNGVTVLLTYDLRDRLLTRTVLGASGNATNSFGYDAAGLLTSLTQPDGSRLLYQYDTAHRLQSVTNSLGESIIYNLDAAGNIIQQNTEDSSGAIVRMQTRVFDSSSRLIRAIGANAQTNSYEYDANGNRIFLTDGLNHTTSRAFDALNRLVAAVDPMTNATAYLLDPQDNLAAVTDPRLLTTSYVYDGFRHVIQENSPDTGTTLYTLDNAGNRTNVVDARGIVRQRSFDELNRVTSEKFPASPGENITYTYDSTAGGNFGVGRLTGYTDETGGTTLTYNERGDVINTTRTIGGHAYTTSYAYDLADHITNITYPSGDLVSYMRDSRGRISSVSYRASGSGTPTVLADNVTYMPFGPMSGFAYGNGLTRTQVYDGDYRVGSIVTSGDGTSVQNLIFGYDSANDVKSIADNLAPGRDQIFGYDPDYRLTNATGPYGGVQYTYDADGNRRTRTAGGVTETYYYPSTGNLLQYTVKGGITRNFSYAPTGNVSSDNRGTLTPLTFNYGNRDRYDSLTSAGTIVAAYKYNALGERLIKIVGAATTHFHYDQMGHLIAESQGNGNLIREYIWMDDMPLAQIEAGGSLYYIHPDQLNTPQKMTDVVGNIVWDREQQPFGETASLTYPEATPQVTCVLNNATRHFQVTVSGVTNYNVTLLASTNLAGSSWASVMSGPVPFTFTDSQVSNFRSRFFRAYATNAVVTQNLRFPGQYLDVESGLNYNMMRDYDTTLGRYIESDPLGNIRGRAYQGGTSLARYDYNPLGRRLTEQHQLNATFGYGRSSTPWAVRDPMQEYGGLNLYSYTSNKPINNADPLGLASPDDAVWSAINFWLQWGNGDVAAAYHASDRYRYKYHDNSPSEADANHYLGCRMIAENGEDYLLPIYLVYENGKIIFPWITYFSKGSLGSPQQMWWCLTGIADGEYVYSMDYSPMTR